MWVFLYVTGIQTGVTASGCLTVVGTRLVLLMFSRIKPSLVGTVDVIRHPIIICIIGVYHSFCLLLTAGVSSVKSFLAATSGQS